MSVVASVPVGRGQAVANLVVTLPWPPSVNHYWKRSRNGGMHVGEEGKRYRWSVYLACRFSNGLGDAPCEVHVVAHPPDRRRRDLDNLLKAVLDSLQDAGVYEDDSQIESITIRRGSIRADGELRVEVCAYQQGTK